MSRQNRPAISLARIVRQCKAPERDGKTIVVVGSVTDDKRIFAVSHKEDQLSSLETALMNFENHKYRQYGCFRDWQLSAV